MTVNELTGFFFNTLACCIGYAVLLVLVIIGAVSSYHIVLTGAEKLLQPGELEKRFQKSEAIR